MTTAPRATTPSEPKKPTINVTVNPKSLSSSNATAKTTKVSKKIDMGAATNFGRDELGINSPTHRNTHSEEDLFATSNTITTTSTANKPELDDIFKTCSTTNNLVSSTVSSQSNNLDDDFFNPRADDTQEFGDFASAFGTTAAPVTSKSEPLVGHNDTKKNDFADFSSAFDSDQQQQQQQEPPSLSSNTFNNDPANLLFAINSTPNAQITASNNSNPKVGDLLSDLDGLSLDVSVPTGKFATFSAFSMPSLLVPFFLMRGHFCSKQSILHLFRFRRDSQTRFSYFFGNIILCVDSKKLVFS